MDIKSKVRAGVASAALAAVMIGGVAIASNATEDDRPVLEQTTVGAPDEGVVEATTTVLDATTTVVADAPAPTTTGDVVETTVVPAETTSVPTAQAPAPTEPEVEMVTVPALRGITAAAAVQYIESLGLVAVVNEVDAVDQRDEGRVVHVSPGEGGAVPVGTTVTLDVARRAATTAAPSTIAD